jgi:Chaperone of endosialidase
VWTDASDRALKHDFLALNKQTVLQKVARMPITSWSYKAEQPGIRHLGPMAQDLYSAFGLGLDDKYITTIDEGGVALAAIQGLYRQNQVLQRQNRALGSRLSRLERQMRRLSRQGR